ncbi:MAG: hypothetical protein ACR2IV_21700 [Bryobacteraceae bacterium]
MLFVKPSGVRVARDFDQLRTCGFFNVVLLPAFLQGGGFMPGEGRFTVVLKPQSEDAFREEPKPGRPNSSPYLRSVAQLSVNPNAVVT